MEIRNLIFVAALGIAGCNTKTRLAEVPTALQSTSLNSLYVVLSDFATGGVIRHDLVLARQLGETLPAHSDALARWDPFGLRLLVVNRLAGNHLTLATSELSAQLNQIPFTEGLNPQDILPLSAQDAYVSHYHSSRLERWNLEQKQLVETIDLSPWADEDGFPEASFMTFNGQKVALALQQLDIRSYHPSKVGTLLVIDPVTNRVDEALSHSLRFPNPFTEFKRFEGDFYLGLAGVMDRSRPAYDGGIERLDGVTFASKGIVVHEGELGGDILGFEILSPTQAVALVACPHTVLVTWNPETGKKGRVLLEGEGFQFSQILLDSTRDLFYVTDRSAADPRVRVFDFEFHEHQEKSIGLKLPPFFMVLAP